MAQGYLTLSWANTGFDIIRLTYYSQAMRFELRPTKDGSFTVFDHEAGECFKSHHAAGLESEVVFLTPGVRENPWYGRAESFRILELGFGLGTNFLSLWASGLKAEFVSIERDLAGAEFFLPHSPPALGELVGTHRFATAELSAHLLVGDFFPVMKDLAARDEKFHCVFFDPFSPKANPEAWTNELFALASDLLAKEGRLVTYSVSRLAKNAALAAGLQITKRDLPAALNKRSALLATKIGSP